MTDHRPLGGRQNPFDPGNLGDYSIEELADYLDRDRMPADPGVESSPQAQLALSALTRLRTLSQPLLERDAVLDPPPDESWIAAILARVGMESRAGRKIPLSHPDPQFDLSVTEGSVRALIRAAGDAVPGILIVSCTLHGDVAVPDVSVSVQVTASVYWRGSIPLLTQALRKAISLTLREHTELTIENIDITIIDAHRIDANGTGADTREVSSDD